MEFAKLVLSEALTQSDKLKEVTRIVISRFKEELDGSWICFIRPSRVSQGICYHFKEKYLWMTFVRDENGQEASETNKSALSTSTTNSEKKYHIDIAMLN